MHAAKSLIVSLFLAAAGLAPVAQAAVINFNDLTGAGTFIPFGTSTLDIGGFKFKGTSATYAIGSDYGGNTDRGSYAYNGSDFYMASGSITLTRATESPFKLDSVDMVAWNTLSSGLTATVAGSKAGGGIVTQTVGLRASSNGSRVTGNDFTSYALVGFDNLNSVTITHNFGSYLAMDNFVVDATSVPEPSSLALFGLAVAAGAFARRRACKAA